MVDGRRHCDLCSKDVIDLSRMTEDEVAARLKAQPGEVCGRVRADGAGRLIFADSLPAGRLRAGALPGLLLGGLLLAGEAEAGGLAVV